MTETNVPRLRFNGFCNEWKESKLGAQLNFINGRAYKQNELLEHGKYKVLRVGNFYTNNEWFYSDLELDDKKYVSKGDLIYTWSATFGPHIWEGDKVIYHYHIWKIELSDLMDKNFVLYFLEYDKNNLLRNTNGSTMIHVTKSSMENKEISFPEEFEQQKIGSFFSKIDKLIELQNKKLDQLKKLKQGYLQKMFPQDGESVPRLRFSGFSRDWKEELLGNVSNIVGGGTPSTSVSEYWNGDINWFSPVEIGDSKYVSNSLKKINKLGLKKSSAKVLPKGSLLFTSRAGIGKTAILLEDASTNQGFQSIVPKKDKLEIEFLYSLSDRLSRYGNKMGSGSTFVEVSGKTMSKMKIRIPNFKEQQQIGEFFSELDQLINNQSKNINVLKQQKKAYLQKMFI